ncbi:MAG: RNase adapter RapZ [Bacteroidota bacterium]|nr:RNase adapter RapZ [Bacteroidota bacterium]
MIDNNSEKKQKPFGKLTVKIASFSFLRAGVPDDKSGNGGGFVFDCRSLPNPGRYERYKALNGKDQPVIEFLEKEKTVTDFLENTYRLVKPSIDKYLERNFDSLMVSYGCTGGQHRSVYFAEKLAAIIAANYNIKIEINHYQRKIDC